MKFSSTLRAACALAFFSPEGVPTAQALETTLDSGFFEENGATKVYETIEIFMFQSFFDNVSKNFIPPLLEGLDYFTLKNITSTIDLFDYELSFDFELDGLKIKSASIDPTPPIVTITNEKGIVFAFNNLTMNIVSNYSYVSDPPIFADIGEASLLLSKTSLSTKIASQLLTGPTGPEF